jgi:hypothetical protein
MFGAPARGGGRRPTLALACTSALLAVSTLAGCGGGEEASGDEGGVGTAVEVGEQLKTAGAPITRPIRDTTFESRWADYPGLSTDAETATASLDLSIEVYDTAADRKWAGQQQEANLVKGAPYSTVTTECGLILVSGVGSKKAARAEAERREFKKVERALASSFGPC